MRFNTSPIDGCTGGSLGICLLAGCLTAACCLTFAPGCFDGGIVSGGGGSHGGDGTGGSGSDDDGSSGGDGDGATPVHVTLTVSDETPQPGTEVILQCSVAGGTATGVTFAFAPDDGRLVIDHVHGTASFVVDESEVDTTLSFTCTGTNDAGTSPASNPVVVIPTGTSEPVLEP